MDLINTYPELVALFLVVVGVIAAQLARRLTNRLLLSVEQRLRLVDSSVSLEPGSDKLASTVVYYVTIAFFTLLAFRSLGPEVGEWTEGLITFVPRIFLGASIIFGGYFLGLLAKTLVSNLINDEEHRLVPQLVQYFVLFSALMTGFSQMGVDVSFLENVSVMVLGLLLGGLSLAFSLGSRELVANLLARREIGRFGIGDTIVVNDLEGTISELTRTGLVLDTERDLIYVPASQLTNSVIKKRK